MCVSNTHLSDTGCVYRVMLTYFIAHFLARCATNVCEGGTEANESDALILERTNEVRTTTTTTASQRSPLSGLTAYSILSLSLLLLVLFGVRRRRRMAVAAAIVARARRDEGSQNYQKWGE